MLHGTKTVIKHKIGLLNLAEELGNVSKACAKLDKKFSHELAVHVSTVGEVPMPKRLPKH